MLASDNLLQNVENKLQIKYICAPLTVALLKHYKHLTLLIQDDLQFRYQQWLGAINVKFVWD
jgi:hypothetical protein